MLELFAMTTALPQEEKLIEPAKRIYPLNREYYYTNYKNAVEPVLDESKPKKLRPQTIYEETTCLVPKREKLIVYFGFNRFDLKPEFEKVLEEKLSKLKGKLKAIYISAYTDKVGSVVANQYIALMRANTVKDFVSKYFPNVHLSQVRGKCCYVSQKDELNRRAEIEFVYKEEKECKKTIK